MADEKPTICILDVDLGEKIEDIINDDVTTITKQNQQDIDDAVETSRQHAEVIQKRSEAETAKLDAIQAAFKSLKTAHEANTTVVSTELLALVQPHITSMNSLVQRLKSLLKADGNKYRLANSRRRDGTHYRLEPFNQE